MTKREEATDPRIDAAFAEATLWPQEGEELRTILHGCDLEEVLKWHQPCYVHDGHNIAIIQRMKGFLALMFFKGALLKDDEGLLQEQGENTRSARRLCFTDLEQVRRTKPVIEDLVRQAIEVAEAGLEIPKEELVLAEELEARLEEDPELKVAFEALTPGRQRGYNIHVSGAKQSKTRMARVEKHRERILAGKGLHDR